MYVIIVPEANGVACVHCVAKCLLLVGRTSATFLANWLIYQARRCAFCVA